MKNTRKRLLAVVLCAAALLAVLSAPAAAFGETYTTVTKVPEKQNEYAVLQSPGYNRLYTSVGSMPRRAVVKSSWANGGIYFMPKPAEGYGTLGTVEDGAPVTIFAELGGLYFFMTDDGRMGWNGKWYFTDVTELPDDEAAPLSEGSDLTVGDALAVSDFLANRYIGGFSWMFYAQRPVVVIENGGSATLRVRALYEGAQYDVEADSGDSAEAAWQGEGVVRGSGVVEFTAREPGATVFHFTNTRNVRDFYVLVLVV